MSLRTERNKRAQEILEGKFIAKVLHEESIEIDANINKIVSSFKSPFFKDKSFSVRNSNTLEYRHKKQMRFVDMKTRATKSGTVKKKRHIIHNRIIYGHLNNIARELSVGFTDAIINEIQKLED